MDDTLRLGLDVGSTTVKAVVLDGAGAIRFSDYRRHNADVRGELRRLLLDVLTAFPDDVVKVAMTGSGGLGVAQLMGVPFVQEVVASTRAIEKRCPQADVVIELGGEDAKITYLHPIPEQRMNGTCAGGTGAFIDQMATLLKTDAAGLDELAGRYQNLYPIASRCGVFAKSDIQPLLNQGAAHEDIAASVFQAVATQTIAGLACGHPIRGTVVFLGGPLHFLPHLRDAYVRALGDHADDFVTPDDGQLYVALGAAMLASGPALSLPHLAANLESTASLGMASKTMRPLFADDAELADFRERHGAEVVPQVGLAQAQGALFLGIDAGSTTIKSVLMDEAGSIVFSTYGSNEGDPIAAALGIARQLRAALPADAVIGRACVTGYGETLVQAALHADEGEVETMAHFRAAASVCPGVTSVIDIGGQDMKFLKIRGGAVDSIAVNEACSSGCGSFLQTFAATMNTDVATFAHEGVTSQAPVDLGSRCTVFMNSSVKQAQKEGASLADISAGLSYSVVRNALYKVIKLRDAGQLGDKVVVQGGTFLNDAVLRAFELLTGVTVVRPNIAGLMGAYGAALTARMHWTPGATSAVMARDLDGFSVESAQRTCQLCQNHCKLTITTFDDGARNVSGNRCERGASLEARPKKSTVPNLYDYKYARVFGYRRLTDEKAKRGAIGIPRALGMYEDYPLWFTILTQLGFKVMLSGRTSHALFEAGMESIPAENVCYPAKLAHGHIEWLIDKGVKTIFFPCVNFERKQFEDADNNYNCPIVAYYPQVIEKNVDRLREAGVRYLDPMVNLDNPENLAKRLVEIFADWKVTPAEAAAAVQAGYEELDRFHADVRAEGDRAMQYMAENGVRGIVLAGRPYHIDPEINHGIPEAITKLGMVVLSEDALTNGMRQTHLERPIRVMDQWPYHTRLYEAAAQVRVIDDLNLVQLNSFGCGVDAITTDEVQEILESAGDVYTVIKIDEVSNLGAATIRLRSLLAAMAERTDASEPQAEEGLTGRSCVRNQSAEASLQRTASPIHAHSGTPLPARQDDGGSGDQPQAEEGLTGRSCVRNQSAEASLQRTASPIHAHSGTPLPARQDDGGRPSGSIPIRHVRALSQVAPQARPQVDPIPMVAVPERVAFTEAMKADPDHTIFAPQMAPIHFRMLGPIFNRFGYRVRILEHASNDDVECGLKFVNNDACFPAIMVIGQLINAFVEGSADPDHSSVLITQTGGMCRATNYVGMLRKGLRQAGYPQVPVLALSLQGIESNPGFKLTVPMLHQALKALVIGDTIQNVLLRVRPYERKLGSANELYAKWDQITREWFANDGYSQTWGGQIGYHKLLRQLVREFDQLPLLDIPRKPRVGVVGEILVKFQPDANNNVVGVLEDEGCEAVLPGLAGFLEYGMAPADWRLANLGTGTKKSVWASKAAIWAFERYQAPASSALAACKGKFTVPQSIYTTLEHAAPVISPGTDAGEGWFLVGEMIELIEQGTPNIVCCQPFACLPNHVVGRGVFKELRRLHPQANIVSVDYDPGASEVNQLNRIKLMVATAHKNAGTSAGLASWDDSDEVDALSRLPLADAAVE